MPPAPSLTLLHACAAWVAAWLANPSRGNAADQLPPTCRSVLDELRIQWEKKLKETGAMEPEPAPEPLRWVMCLYLHVLPSTAWLQILLRPLV